MPQAGAAFVDVRTGQLTIAGYRWAINIWSRTGADKGSNSASTLQSANNLSDLASPTAARGNLGLGSAATQSAGAFATAAQGAHADTALGLASTALQPNTPISVTTVSIGGHQVLGPQITGWGTPTGGVRGSGAAYGGQTIGATYTQSQVQQTDDAVKALSQKFMALIADLETQGLIAT